ncbi:MAG: ligand-binding sensor domain-containing protein, partial [Adhaeribacter sp.]
MPALTRWRLVLLACLAFLALPLGLMAQTDSYQTDSYKFSRVSTEEGHINNQVNCILKDSRGYMWFGTNAGLNRYNGYAFEVFQHAAGDTSSLSADFIVNLAEDPRGYIWVF